MIGLRKSVSRRTAQKRKWVFHRFRMPAVPDVTSARLAMGEASAVQRNGGTLYAKSSVNCDFSNGYVTQGAGANIFYTSAGNMIKNLRSSEVKKIFCVRMAGRESYFMEASNGYVRLYDEAVSDFSVGLSVGSNARGELLRSVTGEEKYLLVGDTKGVFFLENESFENAPSNWTRIFCTCKNRLFMLLKNGNLAYSNPMTPWDFSESIDDGGYIQLPLANGAPIALAAVDEFVYIVFKYAIMRLCVKGRGRDFCLEEVFYSGDRIQGKSVCAIDDGIVFFARDGLWKVRGREIIPLCKGSSIYKPANVGLCNAAIFHGKYFIEYQSETNGKVSVAVDLDGENWSFCQELIALSKGFDTPLFVKGDKLYQLDDWALAGDDRAIFQSLRMDFGVRGKKILRRVECLGEGYVLMRIGRDGKEFEWRLNFVDGKATLDLDMRGEEFYVLFAISYGGVVRGLSFEVES